MDLPHMNDYYTALKADLRALTGIQKEQVNLGLNRHKLHVRVNQGAGFIYSFGYIPDIQHIRTAVIVILTGICNITGNTCATKITSLMHDRPEEAADKIQVKIKQITE